MARGGQVLLSFFALFGVVVLAGSGNLYGNWQLPRFQVPSTINLIDPNNGAKGQPVFRANLTQGMFPCTPAVDRIHKRIFMPYVPDIKTARALLIVALDFSDPLNAKNLWNVSYAPSTLILGVQYDPVLDGVFVVGVIPSDQDTDRIFTLGFVDAATKTYRNITTFPKHLVPSTPGGLYGPPMALDIKNRVIVFGTYIGATLGQPLITVYDINSQRFVTRPSETFMLFATAYCAKAQQLLSIVGPYNGTLELSVAILDPLSASYKILSTWDPALIWMTGAFITLAEDNGKFYSLVQHGTAPSLVLVTADIATGKLEGVAVLGTDSPTTVFYL